VTARCPKAKTTPDRSAEVETVVERAQRQLDDAGRQHTWNAISIAVQTKGNRWHRLMAYPWRSPGSRPVK